MVFSSLSCSPILPPSSPLLSSPLLSSPLLSSPLLSSPLLSSPLLSSPLLLLSSPLLSSPLLSSPLLSSPLLSSPLPLLWLLIPFFSSFSFSLLMFLNYHVIGKCLHMTLLRCFHINWISVKMHLNYSQTVIFSIYRVISENTFKSVVTMFCISYYSCQHTPHVPDPWPWRIASCVSRFRLVRWYSSSMSIGEFLWPQASHSIRWTPE